MLAGNPQKAARVFDKAARQQEKAFADSFDPPPWWYPIRRSVAAAKLKAGDAKAAQAEAEASLTGWPDDPLALLVLSESRARPGPDRCPPTPTSPRPASFGAATWPRCRPRSGQLGDMIWRFDLRVQRFSTTKRAICFLGSSQSGLSSTALRKSM